MQVGRALAHAEPRHAFGNGTGRDQHQLPALRTQCGDLRAPVGDRFAIEPAAAPIHRRFETLAALSAAGIETGVAIAPIIAGLNDRDVPRILERAAQAGAKRAFKIPLRLSREVLPVFTERLREARPDAADKVLSAIQQIRGGALNDTRFGERMTGQGARWQVIEDLFALHAKKLGLNASRDEGFAPRAATFERPRKQLTLF